MAVSPCGNKEKKKKKRMMKGDLYNKVNIKIWVFLQYVLLGRQMFLAWNTFYIFSEVQMTHGLLLFPLPPRAKYWMYVEQNSLHLSKRFCLNYLKLLCCGFADCVWDFSSSFGVLQWWLCWGVRIFPKLFQINRSPRTLNISPFLWKTSSFFQVLYRLQSLGYKHRTELKIE